MKTICRSFHNFGINQSKFSSGILSSVQKIKVATIYVINIIDIFTHEFLPVSATHKLIDNQSDVM